MVASEELVGGKLVYCENMKNWEKFLYQKNRYSENWLHRENWLGENWFHSKNWEKFLNQKNWYSENWLNFEIGSIGRKI